MLENLLISTGFTLVSTLLAWLIKSIIQLQKEINKIENRVVEKVGAMVEKEKVESVLSHRRHAITDRVVSKLTDRDYDSRQVVDGGEIPDLHPKIRKLIHSD